MKGLKKCIKDKKQRKRHILENMIYTSELTPKNCWIYKNILDPNNKYKLNIYCGDSLTLDTQKEWGIEKFDIIVGNPPYNKVELLVISGTFFILLSIPFTVMVSQEAEEIKPKAQASGKSDEKIVEELFKKYFEPTKVKLITIPRQAP